MAPLALTVIAAAAALVAVVALRRRRARPSFLDVEPRVTPSPAGVQHLARTLSDLSDGGLHLHAARGASKPRLGSLLDLR